MAALLAPPDLVAKVDIGSADPFLEEQLRPEELRNACFRSGQSLEMVSHEGYDHSYFFVASVIERHLDHHANALTPDTWTGLGQLFMQEAAM